MNSLIIQIIRSSVPVGVGAGITWLISIGLTIPEDVAANTSIALVALISSLYYIAVAALEKKIPAFGWLLGVARNPVYPAQGEVAISVPSSTETVIVSEYDGTKSIIDVPTIPSSAEGN